MSRPARALAAALVLLAGAADALAQSDTGRHRPPRPAESAATPAASVESTWQIGLAAGMSSGGDLFRARAGGSVPWDPEGAGTFGSSEFTATLDEGPTVGVTVLRRLGTWLRLRVAAGVAQLPITAEARVGETVRLYEYDDLDVLGLGAGLEARLTRAPSHPYVLAEAGLTRAGGASTDAYDQTVFAGSFGVGYHQIVSHNLALRLEIRDRLQSLDFADYRPPVALAVEPNITVENEGPQHLLEIVAGLAAGF